MLCRGSWVCKYERFERLKCGKCYYNEYDKRAAQWLRELIKAGLIADGYVDERNIVEVRAGELEGYKQCHFFAGIGGWSYALRLAGWSDTRPVWTGSCPCQPFSIAGKKEGASDPRHLWPEFRRLIVAKQKIGGLPTIFGEQVASKDGRLWLDGVLLDLEALGLTVGAVDNCSAGVGAPEIRQRLWWVADLQDPDGRGAGPSIEYRRRIEGAGGSGVVGGMADKHQDRCRPAGEGEFVTGKSDVEPCGGAGKLGGLGNCIKPGLEERECDKGFQSKEGRSSTGQTPKLSGNIVREGFWDNFEIVVCRDKIRRVEPGTFPLEDGLPGRVGLLRGYGNAICPQAAAQFIGAYDDI